MLTPHPAQSDGPSKLPSISFRESLLQASRFWEPKRLVYNLLLTAVVVLWIAVTWPHFREALKLSSLLPLLVLALLANGCYCAAYLVDIPMQRSAPGSAWNRGRWGLWVIGTLSAIILANYWIADEIFPDFH